MGPGLSVLLAHVEPIVPHVQAACLALYALAQLLLLVYSSHRYVILWRWWRLRRRPLRSEAKAKLGERDWPVVTVQLPVYNERFVVERLIETVTRLEYPAGHLEIQVLDDSTDDTTTRVAVAVAHHRSRGVDIHHVRREARSGFKAGALAAGLARARGELLVVFDADFLPAPGFLMRVVPQFDDSSVGMVQARWGHLNRNRSALTAAQAVMLDAHFSLEQVTRMGSNLFFNFNGTAGVWRRACIEDAGGWSHDTLTEDLDLSYRAQLKGWRFRFDDTIESPAELPVDIGALKSQQRRWAKGSIQTARKLLPEVFAASLPLRQKWEAFFHLTANLAYPLLLLLGVLLLPVMLGTPTVSPWLTWTLQGGVLAFGVLPVAIFLGVGQWERGAGWRHLARDVPLALVLGAGLSLNNTRAVVEGLGGHVGAWERTPKTGDRQFHLGAVGGYASAQGLNGAAEIGLAAYFAVLAAIAWRHDCLRALPFLAILHLGFSCVGLASLRASLATSRRARARRT